jgi:hypothetical protein
VRSGVYIVLLLVFLTGLLVQPAWAQFPYSVGPQTIGFPFVTTETVTFFRPFNDDAFQLTAVNTSTLARGSSGTLAIAFTPAKGPQGSLLIAPVIAQTTNAFTDATSSWLYSDHT